MPKDLWTEIMPKDEFDQNLVRQILDTLELNRDRENINFLRAKRTDTQVSYYRIRVATLDKIISLIKDNCTK